MFKFVLILIMFASCIYIGFYFGEVYKYRTLELKEFQKALTILNTEVLYSNTPLPLALLNTGNKLKEPFSNVFKDVSELLEKGEAFSVYDGFQKIYIKYKDQFHLKDDDLRAVEDFFYSLGESGVYGQEKIFSLADEELKRRCLEAEEECKVNRKMYRGVGICVGAIIAIFFM